MKTIEVITLGVGIRFINAEPEAPKVPELHAKWLSDTAPVEFDPATKTVPNEVGVSRAVLRHKLAMSRVEDVLKAVDKIVDYDEWRLAFDNVVRGFHSPSRIRGASRRNCGRKARTLRDLRN